MVIVAAMDGPASDWSHVQEQLAAGKTSALGADRSRNARHESVVLVPRGLIEEHHTRDGMEPASMSLTYDEFDALFDRFSHDVFRLETLQHYAVSEEDERLRAFRDGTPRPERSLRTSPWLARIAVTTVQGKRWSRIHVVEHPLSEYLRYELLGYIESAAVGEEIRITDRAADPDLVGLGPDFWLFDTESADAYAVLMHYDQGGEVLGFEHTSDQGVLRRCRAQRDTALKHSVALNKYLAKADVKQTA